MSNILKNIILLNSAVLIVIEPVSASENIFGQKTTQHGVRLFSVPQNMETQESPAEYTARQEKYRSRQGLDPLQQGDRKETPAEYTARQEKNEKEQRARQEKNEKEHRARQEKYREQLLDKAGHLGLHNVNDASIEVLKTLIGEEKKSRQRKWEQRKKERRDWEQRLRELGNSIGSVRSNHPPETNSTYNSSPSSRSNYQNQPDRVVNDGMGGWYCLIPGKDGN